MDNHSTSLSASLNQHADNASHESLSPLEQEVLDEYAKLVGNLNNVRLTPTHPMRPS
jgi:hypothetical protein